MRMLYVLCLNLILLSSLGCLEQFKTTQSTSESVPTVQNIDNNTNTGTNTGTNTQTNTNQNTVNNQAPQVNAGADRTIVLNTPASFSAFVQDDGLPTGATLNYAWSKVSGPGAVIFSSATSVATNASFSVAGVYVLRFYASDSLLSNSDDVQITITTQAPVVVSAYYVSPAGSDTNNGLKPENAGTGIGPLKTVQKALTLVASTSFRKIILREGVYPIRRQSSLLIDSRHNDLQISAYPGETPIISGGEKISGFSKNTSTGIWSATVPESFEDLIGGVTVNGDPYIQARHPNIDSAAVNPLTTGWLFTQNVIMPAGQAEPESWQFFSADNFRYRIGDLSADMLAGEKVRFVFWDKLGWASDIPEIQNHNVSERTIRLKTPVQFGIDSKTRYYIMGSKKALDAPGEFYHDKANHKLMIFPKPGFDANSSVYATGDDYYAPNLLLITGARNVEIQGITFRDQFSLPYWGREDRAGVIIQNGGANKIINCHFLALSRGVIIKNSNDNIIQESYLHDLVADGIILSGESNGNQVIANHITRFGQPSGRARGIEAEYGANRIAYNLIEDASQFAIATGGDSPGAGILIENNIIRNGCRLARDCGIVYMKNSGRFKGRDTVRNNLIEKSNGMVVTSDLKIVDTDFTFGIYMDESQSGTDIYNNVIRSTQNGAFMIHMGGSNNVTNNIFIDAKVSQYRIDNVPVEKQTTNKVEKNIVSFNDPTAQFAYFKGFTAGSINKNMYHLRSNASASYFMDNILGFDGTYRNWVSKYKQDQNSIIGDPLFENFTAADYRLKPQSPAILQLGFTPVTLDDVGLDAYYRAKGKVPSYPRAH